MTTNDTIVWHSAYRWTPKSVHICISQFYSNITVLVFWQCEQLWGIRVNVSYKSTRKDEMIITIKIKTWMDAYFVGYTIKINALSHKLFWRKISSFGLAQMISQIMRAWKIYNYTKNTKQENRRWTWFFTWRKGIPKLASQRIYPETAIRKSSRKHFKNIKICPKYKGKTGAVQQGGIQW